MLEVVLDIKNKNYFKGIKASDYHQMISYLTPRRSVIYSIGIHEGTKVTQLRRQGINTEISRFNDNVTQHNAKHLNQQQQQKESVLQRGLNRVDQGFEQWQKNQESKRLELERQAEMKRQQELDKQRAEQANRKASRDLDNDGWSR